MKKIPLMNLKDCFFDIYDEVMEKLENLIQKTQFIGGDEIDLFEKEFAEYCGTKYAVGCSNGTAAIEIGLKILRIGKGDKVLVPVNTFIATAEAVINVGADVVFIDVDEYYTIDTEKIIEFLKSEEGKNVKAIIPVHLYGQMANMPVIMEIAKKYDLKVIEDAAQAHGARIDEKRPGQYGNIASFSFYPGKNLGAFGDAGAVVMNDKDIYEKAKMLVNHGRKPEEKYKHHQLGGDNKRIDTIQAAVLRIKLKYIESWTAKRRKKVDLYMSNLRGKNGIGLPLIRTNAESVWHLFVIKVKNREHIMEELKKRGISTGIHYPIALHQQPAFSFMGYKEGDFPVSEENQNEILSLPLWPEISEDSIDFITDELVKIVQDY